MWPSQKVIWVSCNPWILRNQINKCNYQIYVALSLQWRFPRFPWNLELWPESYPSYVRGCHTHFYAFNNNLEAAVYQCCLKNFMHCHITCLLIILSIQVVLISGETGSGKTTQVMNLNLTINNQLKLKGEQCLFS